MTFDGGASAIDRTAGEGAALQAIVAGLAAGTFAPYLGPGVFDETCPVPTTPQELALALHSKVAVSGRIRGNLWATAQFIEGRRHRSTLTRLMVEIFRPQVMPTPLHRALAGLKLPLIVDTWYDGAMRTALVESGRTDWCEIQGATRAGEFRDVWTRAYDASGAAIDPADADRFTTILYKPHGGITPGASFLVSDSDYVEVLTEIDIQTPLPDIIKTRRADLHFVCFGCRFDDQMLRTFVHQISKRSLGLVYVTADAGTLTRNETRFLAEHHTAAVDLSPDVIAAKLCAARPVL